MTKDGIPKLSDFGQARAVEKYTMNTWLKTPTQAKYSRKGTVNWMAPEIAMQINENMDPIPVICTESSDMWSYGMVIYVGPWSVT